MKEQVGLFGGSFNPPHIGHTLAITYVLSQYVGRVIVVPAYKHALGKDLAPFKHRVAMARQAFGWLNGNDMFLKVSVLNIEQEIGHSRTLDTIKALYDRFTSDIQLRLIIGTDILEEKDKWHKFDEIEKLAPPIVIGRKGYAPARGALELPEVSSSNIRCWIGTDLDSILSPGLKGWVHPDVREYIKKHNLYKGT